MLLSRRPDCRIKLRFKTYPFARCLRICLGQLLCFAMFFLCFAMCLLYCSICLLCFVMCLLCVAMFCYVCLEGLFCLYVHCAPQELDGSPRRSWRKARSCTSTGAGSRQELGNMQTNGIADKRQAAGETDKRTGGKARPARGRKARQARQARTRQQTTPHPTAPFPLAPGGFRASCST